jgi:hypothetical protein
MSFDHRTGAALVWLAAAVALPAQQTGYRAPMLSPSSLAADITLLDRALREVHAGTNRYAPARVMDTAFARLRRRAEQPMTAVEFYHDIALLLARIRCNHTKAELPPTLQQFRDSAATHLPVQVRVVQDRILVLRSEGGRLPVGNEITAINTVAAPALLKAIGRYSAVDGFTDFARAALFGDDSDLMGADLDHYWPIEYGFATQFVIASRNARGRARTDTLPAITWRAWQQLSGDTTMVDVRNGTRWQMLDDTTAQLTVRSFVNYRTPVNVDSLYGGIFDSIRARGARHLIVDLRENGGGSDDASWGLVRHLITAPVQPSRGVRRRTLRIDSTLAAAFDTWGDRATIFTPAESLFTARADGWYVERGSDYVLTPSARGFAGRVSLLTSQRNSSGATMLLAVLQEAGRRTGRIRLVGEETGGSAEGPTAGQILFLRLPSSGIRVRIPLKRSDVNVDPQLPMMGVLPDIDAASTVADVRAGIDRALIVARTALWRLRASPFTPVLGVMRGVLEYRDYGNGKRVTIPATLHSAPVGATGAIRQRVLYDDGPGNQIYSTDQIRISGTRWIEGSATEEGGRPTGEDTLRIVSTKPVSDGVEYTLRGNGMDDNVAVEFRYRVTIGPRVWRRLKEFRKRGGSWEYRHEYRYERQ